MNVNEAVGKKIIAVTTGISSREISNLMLEFDDGSRLIISEKYIEGFGWAGFYTDYNEKIIKEHL